MSKYTDKNFAAVKNTALQSVKENATVEEIPPQLGIRLVLALSSSWTMHGQEKQKRIRVISKSAR